MSTTGTFLEIDVDAEVERIIQKLNRLPNQLKAPSVLAKALNATATEMKREMNKRTRKRYAITDSRVFKDKSRGGLHTERATGASAEVTLLSKGPMLDVMAYMTRANDGATAAMVKVLKQSSLTAIEAGGRKAFVSSFKSGHTAIVQRRTEKRLPVKKLMAPAMPFGYGKTYEEAELAYYTILQKHIDKQVEKAL